MELQLWPPLWPCNSPTYSLVVQQYEFEFTDVIQLIKAGQNKCLYYVHHRDRHLVVKLSKCYGQDAHAQWEMLGYAPKFTAIDTGDDSWKMIEMEALVCPDGWYCLDVLKKASEQVKNPQISWGMVQQAAVDALSEVQKQEPLMVHGDMRLCNIMFNIHTKKINFIDFDSAGKEDSVFYPRVASWFGGSKRGAEIKAEHDMDMLRKELGLPPLEPEHLWSRLLFWGLTSSQNSSADANRSCIAIGPETPKSISTEVSAAAENTTTREEVNFCLWRAAAGAETTTCEEIPAFGAEETGAERSSATSSSAAADSTSESCPASSSSVAAAAESSQERSSGALRDADAASGLLRYVKPFFWGSTAAGAETCLDAESSSADNRTAPATSSSEAGCSDTPSASTATTGASSATRGGRKRRGGRLGRRRGNQGNRIVDSNSAALAAAPAAAFAPGTLALFAPLASYKLQRLKELILWKFKTC